MKTNEEYAKELLEFINESPTPYHAVLTTEGRLKNNNFIELKDSDKWNLTKGGKYYLKVNDSAIFAFVVGEGEIEETGFKIISAHTDSPGFKIKPKAEIITEGKYISLNTEVYGGPILNTWMDRPLSIAGRVTVNSDGFLPKKYFVNIKKPLLVIPNLAIHFNRRVNEGVELNPQRHTLPLLTVSRDKAEEGFLRKLLAKEIDVKDEDILDYDLFLYEYENGSIIGAEDELISSSRLDNLAMVHAGLEALIHSPKGESTKVVAFFDNEEIGSATRQGADSEILVHLLERIVIGLGKGREELFRAYANSFMISADLAHAVHPILSEKYDPLNRAVINGGPVIKISAAQKYTSDSVTTGVFEMICKRAGVPVQKFVNRSDERGGSTIGPISSTHLPIRSVDIGTPILAMHSVRELGGVDDQGYVIRAFLEFYKK
ncbi:MAG: M18 family aminopeptidase [Clostridiales bacterium]|uniref:M18 family aminopeptidase n=1 Tax=Clostridium sp. N3C TaxID=1776758 RepID=UPI00092E0F8C|nr:M18 family aminopeptidase [Clostridium sp. N3C]NLZ48941.1 M18 family aminopeptidase [Clostridiales bacterium]SCN24283.1 putative M18 family aminopeptidase 2 [Clostridium sp. N3C]